MPDTHHVAGTVEENGQPVSRTIRVMDAATGALLVEDISTGGSFDIGLASADPVFVAGIPQGAFQPQVVGPVTPIAYYLPLEQVDKTSAVYYGNGGVDVATPAHTEGDLFMMLVALGIGSSASANLPPEFTLLDSIVTSAGQLHLLQRRATATEPTSFNISWVPTAYDSINALIVSYRNAGDLTNYTKLNNANGYTVPSLTVQNSDSHIVAAIGSYRSSQSQPDAATGYEILETVSQSYCSLFTFRDTAPTPGATGDLTFQEYSSSSPAAFHIEVPQA